MPVVVDTKSLYNRSLDGNMLGELISVRYIATLKAVKSNQSTHIYFFYKNTKLNLAEYEH